ncbi:MAG: glycosyl hydrolase, partial [Chloroflexota bacterium]
GDAIWGGLQDNGESLLLPTLSTMVSPFGGDGGDTLVDPNDGDRAVVEYVDLDMALTTTGGRSDGSTVAFVEMTPSCFAFTYTPSPCDPNPRFIAPFRADVKSIDHWVSGGQYVWDNQGKGWDTRCSASACDWRIVYNTGSRNSTTAIGVNGNVTYAGWCGPSGCNPLVSSTTGEGFRRGIATNYGGTWHELSMGSLPLRYVTALTVDPANAAHVYAVFGGFSRHWVPNAGVGHVFETTDGGATWTDISGALPDAPADDLLIVNGKLVLATDVGAFIASATAPTVWSRYGSGLPNSAIYDLSLGYANGGYIIASTHGRGLWKVALPTP